MIPISSVLIGKEEEDRILEVLRSGMLAQGEVVAELERGFAALTGTAEAVAVNSGTTALVAALQALGVGPGDEVVTSPFTFVATLNAILEAGATARFADIGLDDYCIDPAEVEDLCSDRTKVLMPVHLYGQPSDMGALVPIAEARGLAIVEDAAQAHGATAGGRKVGGYGTGCFSLYATKNIAAGEGGVITTDDEAIADRLRLLRNQGMRRRYEYEIVGHNYRMTDLQAAVAVPQLARIETSTASRARCAAQLTEGLQGLPGVSTPRVAPGRTHVFHQYTVRIGSGARRSRDEVIEGLGQDGIGSGIYYPKVVFDYACYREHPGVAVSPMPRAEQAANEVLSLPVHPGVSHDEVERIIASMRRLLEAN